MNFLNCRIYFCLIIVILASSNCKRIYDNPFDPNADSSTWSPENLNVTILNNNLVNITWSQNEDRIDGFVLTNENYPNDSVIISKNDSSYIDNSIFINQNCGFQFNYTLKAYAGDNFSDEIFYNNCIPAPSAPSLSTINITNLTTSSAYSGGNISSDGGAYINQKGICYSTSTNPSILNNLFINNGGGSESYQSVIQNLSINTTYYVRAYAFNYMDTAYGNEISFTTLSESIATLSTNSVININSNSAESGGNITNDGNAAITSRGVCWSTSPNPTISNNITTNGTGTGSFSSTLSNLSSGTTYYVRAYATNSLGTAYGNELSFSTSTVSTLPVVTTSSITNITSNSAQSGGNVTNDGNSTVSSKGICWSTSPNPTNGNVNFMTIDGTGTGSYTSSLTNLSTSTTYYVRAYASNSSGTAYGNEISFNTVFQNVNCNITSTTNNVNGWYFLLDPTTTVYYSSDTYTIEMSSPSNYHFSPQNTCELFLNEQLVQNIGNQFSSYYDSNGLLIYAQDFIIPSGLTPSNCYTVRVNKAQDTWISNPFTILP